MLLERGRVYMAALSDTVTPRPSHYSGTGQNTDEEALRRKRLEDKTGNIKKSGQRERVEGTQQEMICRGTEENSGSAAGNTKGLGEDSKGMWKNTVTLLKGNAGRAIGGATGRIVLRKQEGVISSRRNNARTKSRGEDK